MEITNKIEENINLILNVICYIYDDSDFSFEKGSVFAGKLQTTFQYANALNTKDTTKELWNATSKLHRVESINKLINLKFGKLLNWKPNITNIDVLNQELSKELTHFYTKQKKVNRNYTTEDINLINQFYIAISHRLFKAILDLKKVKAELRKMAEEEKTSGINEEMLSIKSVNVKLHPDKIDEFTSAIVDMYKKNFFIPIYSSKPFSNSDLLKDLGKLLNTEILIPDNELQLKEPVFCPVNGKVFADYLLHENKYKLAEEIRLEFSTEKGKAIRLLLYVLENINPPLITIGYRQAKALYKSMSLFFNRDIGTYQSVFNTKIEPKYDQKDLDKISIRLNHLLLKLTDS